MIVFVTGQKGGVGKSTIARLIAVAYAQNNWDVKIADMDVKQQTSQEWAATRFDNDIRPFVQVETFSDIGRVQKAVKVHDMVVIDPPGYSSKETGEAAQIADAIIIPVGLSVDDLSPTIKLCHEFVKKGISKKKFALVFSRTGNSESEIEAAKQYIADADPGYRVLEGRLREKPGYRDASNNGKSAIETSYASLNREAAELVQSIVSFISG